MTELIDSEGNLASPGTVDAVRGSVVLITIRWIQEHGSGERYRARLPEATRNVFDHAVASDWLSVPHVTEHYRAIESLEMADDRVRLMGGDVSDSVNGVVVKTIARLAGKAGASPSLPLSRSAKLFARSFRGGAAAAYAVSPREVRFEVHGSPFAVWRVHRLTLEGALLHGLLPFARTVRVNEIPPRRTPSSYALRIVW
ncbi:hypothetical protein BH09MYX1_BH09MYX1_07080 [soil metagenome]